MSLWRVGILLAQNPVGVSVRTNSNQNCEASEDAEAGGWAPCPEPLLWEAVPLTQCSLYW